jgi:hypothetical protein
VIDFCFTFTRETSREQSLKRMDIGIWFIG